MTPKTNTKSAKSLPNSVGIMAIQMSVQRHLDMPYESMGQFVHAVAFNAGVYFRMDRQAFVWGSFSVSFFS